MNWLVQVVALIGFNLRTLPARLGSAAAAVFGIAGVVAVLVGVLSIGEGFRKAMVAGGSPDTVFVLRAGADTEMTSILQREEMNVIAEAPGVARSEDGKPLVSPELFVIVNLPKRSTGTDANVPMRGVERPAFRVHDDVRIVEGRPFAWGRNEVIVGRGARAEFAGLDLGAELVFGQTRWKVVGVFSGGGVSESEIWTDAAVLAPAYRRGSTYQSAVVKLASPGSFQQFKDALTADPRINARVVRETEYYAEQSEVLRAVITGLAFVISALMGMGAIFGALNTMYTAVAARNREIATLEAIGFRSSPVIISVLAEAVLLAVIGGLIGAVGAYLAFDGYRTATMNWQSFSQVAFAFDVNGRLMIAAMIYAVIIGFIGGLFPAIRAVRTPVAVALRGR